MIGAFVSSIIQIFISEETIAKIIPKNKIIGLISASLIGLIFPVCECAIVPIVRRLIKKGVPIYIGITFMLATPIVNPVVLASTYYAFSDHVYMVFLRGYLGVIGAILIGYIVYITQKSNPIKTLSHDKVCCMGCSHSKSKKGVFSNLLSIVEHTSSEVYNVGKFLIIGAFLSALMQTLVSRNFILSVGEGNVSSTFVMMGLAYILSLCSEADAFIAKTFLGQFTVGSIVSFLVMGPMIDLKNTLMLLSSFKVSFVLKLILIVFVVCFIMAMMINMSGVWG